MTQFLIKNLLPWFLLLITSSQVALATPVIIDNATSAPPPQIAAAPARVTVDISQGRAGGSIRVFNLGKEPVTVNTQVNNWTLDEANKVQLIASTPRSLDRWIIVNPIDFTIPPGGQQVVRYSIRPLSRPTDGEHKAMIFFNQTNSVAQSDTIGTQFRMGVAVYGVAGNITKTARLHNISVSHIDNRTQLALDIENTGNAKVRLNGQISIWPKSKFPGKANIPLYDLSKNKWSASGNVISAGALSSTPVLAGSRRTVKSAIELPKVPGNYIAYVNGRLGDQSISERLEFQVP